MIDRKGFQRPTKIFMQAILNILLIVLISFTTSVYGFHTPPDKWKEPRMVFGDLEKDFDINIKISRINIKEKALNEGSKNYSPNKAYWFIVDIPDTTKTPPWSLQIRIFNERDYLICIVISDLTALYETKVHWINDKLMYVQFWWGRLVGAYLIFDVEKERIVLKESFTYGEIILQQWQEKGK